jgi:hypothetical protein
VCCAAGTLPKPPARFGIDGLASGSGVIGRPICCMMHVLRNLGYMIVTARRAARATRVGMPRHGRMTSDEGTYA